MREGHWRFLDLVNRERRSSLRVPNRVLEGDNVFPDLGFAGAGAPLDLMFSAGGWFSSFGR